MVSGSAEATSANGQRPSVKSIFGPRSARAGRKPRREISDADLDVRHLPPARRHATIFDTYRALLPGTAFVLVNDHDPKPLRYQLEAEHAGRFTWDYLKAGPDVWRVRIGRGGA
jgi:uncharacterized protein (DUF2249 family)